MRASPPRRRALRGAELRDAEPGAVRGGAVRRGGRLRLGRRSRAAPACWSARMAAPCCSTRRRTCRSRPRARSSARLQEQGFERVGGATRVKVDVRVLATTNRDLQAEIAAGRFREDLYYRLAVVPLRTPSLRERREDVPALARHFMARSAETSGMPPREIGEDALAALQAYDWPGNVRQLRNLVDWLLIMAPGEAREPIRADMLPPEVGSAAPAMLKLDRSQRDHDPAAARRARAVRAAVPRSAAPALRRQHQPHRELRRHGAQRAAPQAEVPRRPRGGPRAAPPPSRPASASL